MRDDPQLVARLLDLLAREVHSEARLGGLAPGQWVILRFLAQHGARDIAAIASYSGANHVAASRAAWSLVRKGLAMWTGSHGGDLQLTPAGTAMLARDPLVRAAALLAALDPEARRDIAGVLDRLLAAMTAQAGQGD